MSNAKSITFFIGPFGSGGGERNCCNLANAFTRNGIDVTVVAIGVKDPIFLKRLDPRVRFVNLGKRHLRHALPGIIRYIICDKPQKVLAFNHYLGTALALLRFIPQFNYFLYMRNIVGLTQKYQMNKSFWQAKISIVFVKLMLRQMDGVISQCEAMKIDLIENWLIPASRIEVIYNPVAEEVEKNLQSFDRSLKTTELLFVGRFSLEKGVGILIEAYHELLKSFPDLSLRLLGEGELEKPLKELSSSLGLSSSQVIFQGFVSDPIPYYKKAAVTVLPSFSEGFPNVLIESLTLGTPVVAFDCQTGPAEIIKHGENGFLVELGNKKELVHSIRLALTRDWRFKVEDYRLNPIVDKYQQTLNLVTHAE